MEEDISKKTVTVLVILTVIISVLSTLSVMSAMNDLKASGPSSSADGGYVALKILPEDEGPKGGMEGTGHVVLNLMPPEELELSKMS